MVKTFLFTVFLASTFIQHAYAIEAPSASSVQGLGKVCQDGPVAWLDVSANTRDGAREILSGAQYSWNIDAEDHQYRFHSQFSDVWKFGSDHRGLTKDAQPGPWRHGTYLDNCFRISSHEEHIDLRGHYSWSLFDRAGLVERINGHAYDGKAELALYRDELFQLSYFVDFAISDPQYRRPEVVRGDDVSNSPFPDPGWQETRLGKTIGVGPITLGLAAVHESRVAGANKGRERIGGDLDILFDGTTTKQDSGSLLSLLLPDSAYFTYEGREVHLGTMASSVTDWREALSFGSYWTHGQTTFNLDFDSYLYDTRQAGASAEDFRGFNLDVALGYYPDDWWTYAYFSTYQAEGLGILNPFSETGNDYSLSLGYEMEKFPDIIWTAELYEFEGHYIGSDVSYTEKSLSLALDFSDLLGSHPTHKTSLKLSAERVRENYTESGIGAGSGKDSYWQFGLNFGLKFNIDK